MMFTQYYPIYGMFTFYNSEFITLQMVLILINSQDLGVSGVTSLNYADSQSGTEIVMSLVVAFLVNVAIAAFRRHRCCHCWYNVN